ncbi:hypothetical protein LguiA_021262 [Lonicera macranthoides]
MSDRGKGRSGGGGGARGGGRARGQPMLSPTSGRDAGRGGRSRGSASAGYQSPHVAFTSHAQPSPVSSVEASSSTSVSLSREVEQKLTLGSPAVLPVQSPAEEEQWAVQIPFSTKGSRMPSRPGFGTVGRKCVIRANHFLVQVADKDIYHYDVSITPEVISKKVCRDIVEALGKSHLAEHQLSYDGNKNIYTAGPLPFESRELVIKLPDKRREREFKVAVKFVAKGDNHHLQGFLQSRHLDAPQETIQALDVVLRTIPSAKYQVLGRSFFYPTFGKGQLGDGLEYWKGYYQSLRPTQMGLSLNIDMSARAFYESVVASDYVAKYLNRDLASARPFSDQERIQVKRALKGVKIEVSHTRQVRYYRVTGVSTQPTNQLRFPVDDEGTVISVVEYFHQKYNIALRYGFLPAINTGTDAKPTYLPMELNEKQVTALLRATCQRPDEREKSIMQIVENNHYNEDDHAKEFGLKVLTQLTPINARVLAPPTKMVNGGRVDFWSFVNFSRMRPDMADAFCHDLIDMCCSKGMVFSPQPLHPIHSAYRRDIENTLIEIHKESSEQLARMGHKDKHIQLLIIILPDASGSYGKIKRICETELGIVSQCCQPKQASKMNKQYLENVALKINVKVVASMDWPEVTKYRGLVSAQSHREEIIQDLFKKVPEVAPESGKPDRGMIRDHLYEFYISTRRKPDRIIFYRDGVSEGQFNQVLLHEIDAIRKACQSLEANYLPRITFVVVQKRHHTRLFPERHGDRNSTDRSGNILPGTVVDTTICHPTEFDFYLCSHAGIQGTSRPAHYHVLYDENKFSADALQTLTNNLCYTYARCTRSVSIVPPAYYAHLAAFRARYYIEGDAAASETESTNTGGGGRATREGNPVVRPLPSIKESVKKVMFYC